MQNKDSWLSIKKYIWYKITVQSPSIRKNANIAHVVGTRGTKSEQTEIGLNSKVLAKLLCREYNYLKIGSIKGALPKEK